MSREARGVALYLETSAALRATLETGSAPPIENRLQASTLVVTSRLSLVESARALHRLRQRPAASEAALADVERELERIWSRCHIWELNRGVCELAQLVAPRTALRSLDALHLATFLLARRRIAGLELLTADERLARAALEI